MNERIKQLAEQCWNLPDIPEYANYRKFNQGKFAELIVQECADYVDAFNRENMVEEGIGGNMLKKYFGVEE